MSSSKRPRQSTALKQFSLQIQFSQLHGNFVNQRNSDLFLSSRPQLFGWRTTRAGALPFERPGNLNLRRSLVATLAIPLLGLAACSSNEAAPSSSGSSPTSRSSSETTKETTTTPAKESTPASAPPVAASTLTPQPTAVEPYVIECLPGTPGPSRMSDGTVRNTEYCGNQPGASEILEAERNAGLDPSEIPYANGGTCPAYKCGYGTAPDGTPNRSSGEIQFEYGCREGYIDPQQCAAAGY